MAERFAGRPLAGVLLLTDGNATDLRETASLSPDLPPVYPVVLGRAGAVRDLALGQVQISQTAFEDAPVSIQAEVLATDFSGEPVVAQLLDARGRIVQEHLLRARKPQDTLGFRFQLRPEQPGLSFYQLRVATRDERQSSAESDQTREATLLEQHAHDPRRSRPRSVPPPLRRRPAQLGIQVPQPRPPGRRPDPARRPHPHRPPGAKIRVPRPRRGDR
ncbi:MAG: hypothetical protein M5U12_19505 [Verrucomicrobia bacterium]|nr:hypothetical protein [Verrucomicrobiota bacterium]